MNSIQILRLIASLFIVNRHINYLYDGTWHFLAFGIDIFFIISGVILSHIVNNRDINSLNFISLRLIRIIPLYYLLTIILFVFAIYFPSVVENTSKLSYTDLFKSLFFIPFDKGYGLYRPLLVVGWTLNYSILVYFLFGLSIALKKKINLNFSIHIFIILIFILSNFSDIKIIKDFYGAYYILDFLLGILIYRFYKLKFIKFNYLITISILLLIVLFYYLGIFDKDRPGNLMMILNMLLPASLLVFFCINTYLPNKNYLINILIKLGEQSYALFLSHYFVISVIKIIFNYLDFNSFFYFYFTSVFLSVLTASLLHNYFDLPLNKYLKNKLLKRG